MPSVDDKSLDGEDPLEPPSQDSSPLHSTALVGMHMHVYPFPNALLPSQQPLRSKRRQVKNACTHCQKACKKCDDARPCLRCVKYGISEECVDSQRKERKKGVKRGPYKKRDGKGSSINHMGMASQATTVSSTLTPAGGPPVPEPYLPVDYPPGLFGQYSTLAAKPGESSTPYNPPYFLATPHIQSELGGASEGDDQNYSSNDFYHQPPIVTPMQLQSTYPIHRSNGSSVSNLYPVFAKHSSDGEQGEMVNGTDAGVEGQEDTAETN